MVLCQFLSVDEVIKNSSKKRLNTPDSSDDAHINVRKMSEVHGEDYKGLNPNIETYSDAKDN
jgi:hypothetical protein